MYWYSDREGNISLWEDVQKKGLDFWFVCELEWGLLLLFMDVLGHLEAETEKGP